MKILKIWFSDYPWDVRVEKFINGLLSHGHEIHLLCRNNRGQERYEKNQFYIHRLPYLKGLHPKLNKLINLPAFFNPVWHSSIVSCIKKYKIDLIIVRDLPLTLPAILAGKLFGIKVIFDMAECHPEIFKNYFKIGFKSLFMQNPLVAKWIEYITIRKVDHIFVMCAESKDRLVSLGGDLGKITVISNTTRIKPQRGNNSRPFNNNEIRMIYIGLIGEFRGLDTLIDGIQILKNKYQKKMRFDILGTGDYLERLKERAKSLKLEDEVIFHGWIDNPKISEYIKESDIGLLPLYNLSHYNVTLSNKLFDYMACSKPVITSNVRSMARIVTETACGLVYEDRNVNQFVKCVLKLTDTKIRMRLGENGRRAVEETYNWNADSERMLKIIDRFNCK